MQIEKKLILCSILAVAIGIAAVAPLAYVMNTKAETADTDPIFDINFPYAYWEANYTTDENGTVTYTESNALTMNYTVNTEAAKSIADGRIEYYLFHFYSDQGPITDSTFYIAATPSNDSFSPYFQFTSNKYFSSNTTCGGLVLSEFKGNQDTGRTTISGSHSGTSSVEAWANSTRRPLMTGLQNANNKIYIDVSRQGFVTFKGDTTTVTSADTQIIQHLELTRYGNGFLYNTLIPEDQLPSTNLLNPSFPHP